MECASSKWRLDKLIASLAHYSQRQWVEVLPLLGRSSREYGPVSVFWHRREKLGLHHLFRELYRRSPVEFPVEEALFLKDRDLFGLDVDLVFFDTTSTYFEGRGPRG